MSENVHKHAGHEATCKIFPDLVDGLKRRGISPEVLAVGLPYTLEELTRDRGFRISWDEHSRVLRNVGDAIGCDELELLGHEMVTSPSHRFGVVVGRMLFSTAEFYRWTASLVTNNLHAFRANVIDLAENRILIEFEMLDGYALSPEVFLLIKGMYSTNPLELGVGRTKLLFEMDESRVRYDIEFKSVGGKLSWFRKSIGWLWAARSAARSLKEVDEVVSRRYADLLDETRARRDAEEALVRVAEKEQERIRRDLHDRVGQELTGLSFLARHLVSTDNALKSDNDGELEAILDGIERTIGEVQSAIKGIQPVQPGPDGLVEALDDLVSKTLSHTGINCTFECDGRVRVDDIAAASQLFYIAQEAVHNACKYANANLIRIRLAAENGNLQLVVHDDGVGLAQSDENAFGYGVNIMHHRANLIDGTLRIESPPEGGVAVCCSVPNLTGREQTHVH